MVTTQPNAIYPVLSVPTSIDYTSKDWTGFVTSMLNYASVVMPDWDTSSEGDFGVMIVELFAYMGDILSYYGDRLTQESYLPTATQRRSILNLAQLLGYTPANGAPATGTVNLVSATGIPVTIVPAGTQFSTSFSTAQDQPVVYESTEDMSVPANGASVATVNVRQGQTTTMQSIGISDGTAGQSFQIPVAKVEDGTTQVYVQSVLSPGEWSQVQFLVDYGPGDQVYSLNVDENNMTNIVFGDNLNGQVPGIGLTVYATYTVGAGSAGNQPAGAVGTMVSVITGITVPFQGGSTTLYQSSEMSGGADPETNDQIRSNAPLAYTTQQRAVSTTDFANLALSVPGVLESSAIANHSTSVTLYVLGPNYQAPTTGLQSDILEFFQNRMLAGVTLTMGTPALIPVDIGTSGTGITLQVLPNYSQSVVVSNVTTALQALLSPPISSFGMLLNVSAVYNTIMQVAGVSYVLINVMTREDVTQSTTNPIQFRPSEVPVAGQIYITASGGINNA